MMMWVGILIGVVLGGTGVLFILAADGKDQWRSPERREEGVDPTPAPSSRSPELDG